MTFTRKGHLQTLAAFLLITSAFYLNCIQYIFCCTSFKVSCYYFPLFYLLGNFNIYVYSPSRHSFKTIIVTVFSRYSTYNTKVLGDSITHVINSPKFFYADGKTRKAIATREKSINILLYKYECSKIHNCIQ